MGLHSSRKAVALAPQAGQFSKPGTSCAHVQVAWELRRMSGTPERRLGPANPRAMLSLNRALGVSTGGAANGGTQRLEGLHSPSAVQLPW